MARYQCVFFDLDHTLWDYEANSEEALRDLYDRYGLHREGIQSFEVFFKKFVVVNNEMWDRHDRGLIPREVIRNDRFHRILTELGIDNYEMSLRFSHDYVTESPTRKKLIPEAVETLEYLSATYPLFIITNGFDEIQSTKLASSGIQKFFKQVITSERAGHKKPAREIFEFALNENGFVARDAIMIGDNLLTDMAGARNADIDRIFFNPQRIVHEEMVTHEIRSLGELKSIL